jgi:AraC-like DNA-binding protein
MGSIFIAHPHERHSTGSSPNPENRHLWIGLCLSELGPDGARLANEIQRRGLHLLSGCEEAEPLLHAIISQVEELRPLRAEIVEALIHAFIALVMQRILLSASKRESPQRYSKLPYSISIHKAITYMRRNLDRRLQLRDLAAVAAFRSVPHFCTRFRREVGLSPALYHMQLRLEAAREMLHQPGVDITNAALEFGFSSSQHFSTLFRRVFGVTPRQWKAHEERHAFELRA